MVEDAHQEIYVLLAIHTDSSEDRVNLKHISLFLGQTENLFLDFHVQQKLSLFFDQVQHLFHLGSRVLARSTLRHLCRLNCCALACCSAGLGKCLQLQLKLLLLRTLPDVAQLLLVKQLVCLEDFVDQLPNLLGIHIPHFAEFLVIRLLEMLVFFLEVFELPGKSLVLLSQLCILVLVLLVQCVVSTHEGVQGLPQFVQPVLVCGLDGCMFLVPLGQDLQVVT
mmetsp:Transcript_11055/g.24342  ORF Transcript_11055/g.24342 Transcript_11055/m.24342 type:complete len:223 (+) Transcript_11055:673-1341(+)